MAKIAQLIEAGDYLVYKGDWATNTAYNVNDVVTWADGRLYEVIKAHTSSDTLKPGHPNYYKAMMTTHTMVYSTLIWSGTEQYYTGNVVRHGGKLYVATTNSYNHKPGTPGETIWELIGVYKNATETKTLTQEQLYGAMKKLVSVSADVDGIEGMSFQLTNSKPNQTTYTLYSINVTRINSVDKLYFYKMGVAGTSVLITKYTFENGNITSTSVSAPSQYTVVTVI